MMHERGAAASVKSLWSVSAPAHPILRLQQTIGNQKVQRLLRSQAIQHKLAISQPGDIYEREADRVAEQVMRMPEPTIQRTCAPCAAGGAPCPKCEAEEKPLVQRKPEGVSESSDSVPDDFVQHLGPGHALDPATRAFMEPRFEHDFSQVRLHTDSKATESAGTVSARAFTLGRHIVFGVGQYTLGTDVGRRLLAHELTHVLQQDRQSEGSSDGSPVLRRFVEKDKIGTVSEKQVMGRYIYTCNCGWVDIDHVSSFAGNYSNLIAELNKKKKGTISFDAIVPGFVKTDRKPVTYNFDTSGMTQGQIDELAIKILYDMATREEYLQGQPWSGAGRWTAASFEDISSDMVGALVGQEMAKNPKLTQAEAIVAVLTKCAPVTKKEAEQVYADNVKTMSSGINWSAVPLPMANDPCARKKPPSYTDFDFTDKKRFPTESPKEGQPPQGTTWK